MFSGLANLLPLLWASTTALPRLDAGTTFLSAAAGVGQGQLPCFHDPPGQLSQLLQVLRSKVGVGGVRPVIHSRWISMWSLEAASSRDIAMFSSGKRAMDIIIDHCCCITMGSDMGLGGNLG